MIWIPYKMIVKTWTIHFKQSISQMLEIICSAANGLNHIGLAASLTNIILLETSIIHYRNLSHRSWIFYIHY